MAKEFEIDAYRKGQDLLVVLRGRLVLRYCQDVKTRLSNQFTPQIAHVYLYLAELAFLDSAGLGVLVGLKMQANRSRTSLTFLSPPPRVEDIFRVSKLNTIFEIQSGPEADVLYATLHREENCLWSDATTSQQSLNVTEHGGTARHATTSSLNITQLPQNETPFDQGEAKVHRLCNEAVEFLRQADYDKAIDAYREALDIDPDNLSALNNLGVVFEKKPAWYSESMRTWKRLLDVSERLGDEKHASRARKHIESLSKLIGAE